MRVLLAVLLLVVTDGTPVAAAERMLPRTVDRTTRLVHDGQSEAAIVYPDVAGGRALGRAVQQAVAQATGVELELVADSKVVDRIPRWPREAFRNRPLILVGNISTNRAIIPLYGNLLAGADLGYPGGDGFTLRTVVNPYGTGVNEIVLGGSSVTGMNKAVQAFAGIVKNSGRRGTLTLPRLLKVVPGGKYVEIVDRASATALNSQWTGRQKMLQTVVEKARAATYMNQKTKSYNPGHYGKEAVVRELIALIQSGGLQSDEVQHVENILLAGLHEEYDKAWIVHTPNWVGTRHQTMGMMGFLVTADYLLNRANPNTEATAFLKKCVDQSHAYFQQFNSNYRDEGNDNTSFDSTGPIGRYMMAFGNSKFFASGAAKLMAQRAIMMIDNRGWFVAPGNYEDVRQGSMNGGVDTTHSVHLPAFVHRDGELRWIIENARGINPMNDGGWAFGSGIAGNRYPFGPDVKAVKPKAWLGVTIQPLTSYYFDRCGKYMTHGGTRRGRLEWKALIPKDRAVEMVTFRDRFAPDAAYLFLNGFQGGRYNSMDANAILRYSDRGAIWLISQTEQLGHYFRNALHIGHGYRSDYFSMPGTIRLEASLDETDTGITVTTLPSFNGADWTRHVIRARDKYFVVIDTARFLDNGDYDLTCTWRSLPIAAMEKDVWVARQMGSRFELHNADGIEQSSHYERARSSEQMSVNPYLLRQHAAVKGRKGEHFSIRNLFFTGPSDSKRGYRLKPVGTDAVVISDNGGYFAMAGAGMGRNRRFEPFTTDAHAFLISTDSIRLAPPGSRLWLDQKPLPSGRAVPEVNDTLKKLWRDTASAKPFRNRDARRQARHVADARLPKPAWSYDKFTRLHEEIGGVTIVDPTGVKLPDELFDRQIRAHSPSYTWPKGTESVTYDLGRLETLSELHLDVEYGQPAGNNRNPFWVKRSEKPITIGFSNDDFHDDKRTMSLIHDRVWRQDPPYIYKPYHYAPKSWRQFPPAGESPLKIKARFVRTPARGCWETHFFRSTTRPAQFDWLEPVDLDGDGVDELAIATEARELVVLDSKGRLRWRKTLDNTITDLLALDLDGDGRQTLLVADNGWYIRGYDHAGNRVYDSDCRQIGLAGAFALGAVVPEGSKRPYITVATGAGGACLDGDGKLYCRIAATGIASDSVLQGSSSAPLARHRTAFRSAWGAGGWRDIRLLKPDSSPQAKATLLPSGGLRCFWWLGLGFEFWPETAAPDDSTWRDGLAVFVARAGLNAYGLGDKAPSTRWDAPAAGPISAYAFADVANGPGMELVLARLDGFIHVLDRNGKMIHTWATQGPVKDIRAWHSGDVVIAAAVGDSVRFYGRGGKEIGRVSGRAERLATLQSSDGSEILVAAGADGKVVAWTSRSISPR